MTKIIEAAYLTCFEPGPENLSAEDLFEEAEKFLIDGEEVTSEQ